MLKKSLLLFMSLALVAALSTSAFAFKGTVTAKDGKIITVQVTGQLPPWVEDGALAKTLDGLAKITAVEGDKVSFKVKKSAAEDVKVGDSVEIKPKAADPGKMLQGC